MNWFKQEYSSWFIDDFVLQGTELVVHWLMLFPVLLVMQFMRRLRCDADGGLVACTPCDIVFLLLPLLETARGKVSPETCLSGGF